MANETKQLPFKLGIDRKRKRLAMEVHGSSGKKVTGSMDVHEIGLFIAILSQCQLALVREIAGIETPLPLDLNVAFDPVAGQQTIGVYEGIKRF